MSEHKKDQIDSTEFQEETPLENTSDERKTDKQTDQRRMPFSRTSRKQPNKEASRLLTILLVLLTIIAISPFVIHALFKPSSVDNKAQTASQITLQKNESESKEESRQESSSQVESREEASDDNQAESTSRPVRTSTLDESSPSVELNRPATTESRTQPEVPEPNQTPGGSYVVQAGDSWYAIARNHGVDVYALAAANGASLETPIQPGQTLVIP